MWIIRFHSCVMYPRVTDYYVTCPKSCWTVTEEREYNAVNAPSQISYSSTNSPPKIVNMMTILWRGIKEHRLMIYHKQQYWINIYLSKGSLEHDLFFCHLVTHFGFFSFGSDLVHLSLILLFPVCWVFCFCEVCQGFNTLISKLKLELLLIELFDQIEPNWHMGLFHSGNLNPFQCLDQCLAGCLFELLVISPFPNRNR